MVDMHAMVSDARMATESGDWKEMLFSRLENLVSEERNFTDAMR